MMMPRKKLWLSVIHWLFVSSMRILSPVAVKPRSAYEGPFHCLIVSVIIVYDVIYMNEPFL
ncbi:unnamed protein product [Nippostrongylus brasiliensis]|uniref:Secreted protein n=1 Tax=Nippostrongylus brasiliensis TaxID=27835 RepID=A0A0N4YS12_NIPBR|nr:unnamed protein product [Nippostrongylus brasiliensis]